VTHGALKARTSLHFSHFLRFIPPSSPCSHPPFPFLPHPPCSLSSSKFESSLTRCSKFRVPTSKYQSTCSVFPPSFCSKSQVPGLKLSLSPSPSLVLSEPFRHPSIYILPFHVSTFCSRFGVEVYRTATFRGRHLHRYVSRSSPASLRFEVVTCIATFRGRHLHRYVSRSSPASLRFEVVTCIATFRGRHLRRYLRHLYVSRSSPASLRFEVATSAFQGRHLKRFKVATSSVSRSPPPPRRLQRALPEERGVKGGTSAADGRPRRSDP
jgi:hypothetical protein